jgi:hypothetical protein
MSGTIGTLGTTFECAFDIVLNCSVTNTGMGMGVAFSTVPGTPRRSEWRQTVPFGLALASLGAGLLVYDAPDAEALVALRSRLNGMRCEIGSIVLQGVNAVSVLPGSTTFDPKTVIGTHGSEPGTTILGTKSFPLQDVLIR